MPLIGWNLSRWNYLANPCQLHRPYTIDTDTSTYALEAILLQPPNNSNLNEWLTIGSWSRSLNRAEQIYFTTKRECVVVVWAIQSLRQYIKGTSFEGQTDRSAVRWMLLCNYPSGRLVRWRLRFKKFHYKVLYRLGLVHRVPHALSKLLHPSDADDCESRDNDFPTFEFSPAASKQRLKKKRVVNTFFWGKKFWEHWCAYKISNCHPYYYWRQPT